MFTRTSYRKIIQISIITILVVTIVVYAVSRSLNYARGPQIILTEPEPGSSIRQNFATIQGKAERITSLSLNGRSISIDEQGVFKEVVAIFPGINQITLIARDQFDRQDSLQFSLFGNFTFETATTS